MKTNKLEYILTSWPDIPIAYLMACFVLICFTAMADVTNSVSAWLQNGVINWGTWGAETNDICAGIDLTLYSKNDSDYNSVSVCVLTSKTNTFWDYVGPPNMKLSKLELQDSNGVAVSPKWFGRKLDGELPQSIKAEDLPVGDERGKSHGGLFLNELCLTAGQPSRLMDFNIQDVYRIKIEGDYTLTICVSIYQFAPDRKSVFRLDLPRVSTKVHLKP